MMHYRPLTILSVFDKVSSILRCIILFIDSQSIYKLIRKVFQILMRQSSTRTQQLHTKSNPKIDSDVQKNQFYPIIPNFPDPLTQKLPIIMVDQPLIKCQNIEEEQSLNNSNENHENICDNTLRKKYLTPELMVALKKAFKELIELQEPNIKNAMNLKHLSQKFDVKYSTLSSYFRQYRQNFFISEGKPLNYKLIEPNRNIHLLKSLIGLSMKEKLRFEHILNFSLFILYKYGIEYDLDVIDRQLRKLYIRLQDQQADRRTYNPFGQCPAKPLLRQLVNTKRTIIYFGKYHFTYQNNDFMVMIMASRFAILVEIRLNFKGNLLYLMKIMTLQYASRFDYKQLWYFIANYEQVFRKGKNKFLLNLQESSFCSEFAPANPRIILLDPSSDTLNCTQLVYRKIILQLFQSRINVAKAIEGIPVWLKNQQSQLCRLIAQKEDELL